VVLKTEFVFVFKSLEQDLMSFWFAESMKELGRGLTREARDPYTPPYPVLPMWSSDCSSATFVASFLTDQQMEVKYPCLGTSWGGLGAPEGI
jgi:hypothetical protein